jgi:hypothetical protein
VKFNVGCAHACNSGERGKGPNPESDFLEHGNRTDILVSSRLYLLRDCRCLIGVSVGHKKPAQFRAKVSKDSKGEREAFDQGRDGSYRRPHCIQTIHYSKRLVPRKTVSIVVNWSNEH